MVGVNMKIGAYTRVNKRKALEALEANMVVYLTYKGNNPNDHGCIEITKEKYNNTRVWPNLYETMLSWKDHYTYIK